MQDQILRIKRYLEIPFPIEYDNDNSKSMIKGAAVSTITNMNKNMNKNKKPVIRLKDLKKYEAINNLASIINPSIKGASTIQKPNHSNMKLNLKLNSNNPIINYVNRMNQKVMEERNRPCTCKNKNGIKGASNSNQIPEALNALNGLSNMLR